MNALTTINMDTAREMMDAFKIRNSEIFDSRGVGGNVWYPKQDEKKYEIRVISMPQPPRHITGMHWGILQSSEGKTPPPVRCPNVYNNSPCPVCEVIQMGINSRDPQEQAQSKKMKLTLKYPMIVLVNEEGGWSRPKIYQAPRPIWEAIAQISLDRRYAPVVDLKNGRNLELEKKKVNGFTKYSLIADPDRTPVDIDESEVPDLLEYVKPRSYDDIRYAMLNGEFPKDEKPASYDEGLPSTKFVDKGEISEIQEEVFDTKTSNEVLKPIVSSSMVRDQLKAKLAKLQGRK